MAAHLTMQDREVISQMHYAGHGPTAIGRALGRSPSSISRELRRNGDAAGGYSAVAAQEKARQRRRERPLVRKMDQGKVLDFVRRGLVNCWSPDQIAGRAKLEFRKDRRRQISHQSIYSWINNQQDRREDWEECLRFGGRKRPADDRRGRIPETVSVGDRPAVVDRRNRYGDWEGDTIVGANRSGAIATFVERKSGYLTLAKMKDRRAVRLNRAAQRAFRAIPDSHRKSLTVDNGKEFSAHQQLTDRLNMPVYFADPYCSWQRGTNENTNGLLRQFVPKGTDLKDVSPHELKRYRKLLNDRPRKRLGYRTPSEVLQPRLDCN